MANSHTKDVSIISVIFLHYTKYWDLLRKWSYYLILYTFNMKEDNISCDWSQLTDMVVLLKWDQINDTELYIMKTDRSSKVSNGVTQEETGSQYFIIRNDGC